MDLWRGPPPLSISFTALLLLSALIFLKLKLQRQRAVLSFDDGELLALSSNGIR